jgi:hypothetical protein
VLDYASLDPGYEAEGPPNTGLMRRPRSATLICHPDTPCAAVQRIEVQVFATERETLELRYVLEGDVARLSIPAGSAPRRADRLWQHTCWEAFVSAMQTGEYYEFNFSPSTEWAIYRFSAYREGMSVVDTARQPLIAVEHDHTRLSLAAVIDLAPLSTARNGPGLRLALSAVIEDAQHRLSYWALAHPPGKPDFHHADGFALELAGVAGGSLPGTKSR